MTTPHQEPLLIQYWHVVSGLAIALFAGIKLMWYRIRHVDRRFVAIEERMPPMQEGKTLATKQYVEDCKGRVDDQHDKKFEQLMQAIEGVHKRIDDLYKMLAERGSHG